MKPGCGGQAAPPADAAAGSGSVEGGVPWCQSAVRHVHKGTCMCCQALWRASPSRALFAAGTSLRGRGGSGGGECRRASQPCNPSIALGLAPTLSCHPRRPPPSPPQTWPLLARPLAGPPASRRCPQSPDVRPPCRSAAAQAAPAAHGAESRAKVSEEGLNSCLAALFNAGMQHKIR